ncbi:unnamed protein product [Clonostachys solani]|uniref:C2H2-type domain-containing protein n=1 Tax=Clonostachys solani TaxID=160281 RepID=A0A9N9ZCK6_9HYPO|nr:unnamed protein product [Clonostachys solani]
MFPPKVGHTPPLARSILPLSPLGSISTISHPPRATLIQMLRFRLSIHHMHLEVFPRPLGRLGAMAEQMALSVPQRLIMRGVLYNCDGSFPSVKELNEHYYVYHKEWAKANGIPDPRRRCMACGRVLPKGGSIKKHVKAHPECHELVGGLRTDGQTLNYSGSEGDNGEGSHQG